MYYKLIYFWIKLYSFIAVMKSRFVSIINILEKKNPLKTYYIIIQCYTKVTV